MSLSDEDLAAISRLLDSKLAEVAARDRRRRRFWLWFWIVVTVVSTIASAAVLDRFVRHAQDEVSRLNFEFSQAKLAYQQQLERDQGMRAERAAAERAVGYDASKTQAEHEAGLLGSFMTLLANKAAFETKYQDVDLADPEASAAYVRDLNQIISQGLNPLGQVMLRNTDPAHNSADEKMQSDVAAPPETAVSTPRRDPAPAPQIVPAAQP